MYLKKIKKNAKSNTKELEKFLSMNCAKNITGECRRVLPKVVEKYKELEDKGIICSLGHIVSLENQKNHQSEDLTNFINSRFDIKFNKENEDLSDNILLPKNLKTINQKLQEKILQKYQIEYTTSKRNREENLQIEGSKQRCIDN
ncbi:24531_t:CDS:2 [Gigaspora margarita]|uniref:24531_t:CDS:1 n=1 Tax=Gigaspora margarita TaxID=4874 RepID=A0ABN7VQL9_GIGMA|nr:24531_t:CDS:2 [Gigaspora margarita]